MSVDRRIGRNLLLAMGHLDPESMIRARSTDPIRASGLVPRRKAGHMTAIDPTRRNAKIILASWGPSTHGEDPQFDAAEHGARLAAKQGLADDIARRINQTSRVKRSA
jgi:hypothetical protein